MSPLDKYHSQKQKKNRKTTRQLGPEFLIVWIMAHAAAAAVAWIPYFFYFMYGFYLKAFIQYAVLGYVQFVFLKSYIKITKKWIVMTALGGWIGFFLNIQLIPVLEEIGFISSASIYGLVPIRALFYAVPMGLAQLTVIHRYFAKPHYWLIAHFTQALTLYLIYYFISPFGFFEGYFAASFWVVYVVTSAITGFALLKYLGKPSKEKNTAYWE